MDGSEWMSEVQGMDGWQLEGRMDRIECMYGIDFNG